MVTSWLHLFLWQITQGGEPRDQPGPALLPGGGKSRRDLWTFRGWNDFPDGSFPTCRDQRWKDPSRGDQPNLDGKHQTICREIFSLVCLQVFSLNWFSLFKTCSFFFFLKVGSQLYIWYFTYQKESESWTWLDISFLSIYSTWCGRKGKKMPSSSVFKAVRQRRKKAFQLWGIHNLGRPKFLWKTGTNSTGNFGPKGDCSPILRTLWAYLTTWPELWNWRF